MIPKVTETVRVQMEREVYERFDDHYQSALHLPLHACAKVLSLCRVDVACDVKVATNDIHGADS